VLLLDFTQALVRCWLHTAATRFTTRPSNPPFLAAALDGFGGPVNATDKSQGVGMLLRAVFPTDFNLPHDIRNVLDSLTRGSSGTMS